MDKLIFNIKDVVYKDLDGTVIPVDLSKPLGNLIYASAASIEWLQASQAIHKGDPAELTVDEAKYLQELINSNGCRLSLICKVGISEYIDKILKTK